VGIALSPEDTPQGLAITEAIWRDMTQFEGYIGHELIEGLDDPGHLLVVSRWATRQRADEVLRAYADHPNAQHANELGKSISGSHGDRGFSKVSPPRRSRRCTFGGSPGGRGMALGGIGGR
jgi:heme-degrading monooxygenase HmoA